MNSPAHTRTPLGDLGPIIAPCWTRHKIDGDTAIRLWTGYSWAEFGHGHHLNPDSCERLSEPLEFQAAPETAAERDRLKALCATLQAHAGADASQRIDLQAINAELESLLLEALPYVDDGDATLKDRFKGVLGKKIRAVLEKKNA